MVVFRRNGRVCVGDHENVLMALGSRKDANAVSCLIGGGVEAGFAESLCKKADSTIFVERGGRDFANHDKIGQ